MIGDFTKVYTPGNDKQLAYGLFIIPGIKVKAVFLGVECVSSKALKEVF